jgi:hypothetical protein
LWRRAGALAFFAGVFARGSRRSAGVAFPCRAGVVVVTAPETVVVDVLVVVADSVVVVLVDVEVKAVVVVDVLVVVAVVVVVVVGVDVGGESASAAAATPVAKRSAAPRPATTLFSAIGRIIVTNRAQLQLGGLARAAG